MSGEKKDKKKKRPSKRHKRLPWVVSIASISFMMAMLLFAQTGAIKWAAELAVGIHNRLFGYQPDSWNKDTVLESVQIGDRIIAALEHYKVDHGMYPQNLDLLTPNILGSIPSPITGDDGWRYVYERDHDTPSATSFRLFISSLFYSDDGSVTKLYFVNYFSTAGRWGIFRATSSTIEGHVINRWPLDRNAVDPLTPPKGSEVSSEAPY